MQALHALSTQGPSSSQASSDSDADNDGSSAASGTGKAGHRHHHGNLSADLKSLIAQLSSSSSTSSSDTSSTSSTALTSLQQSFSGLMTALGDTSSNATLGNFLQAFAGNLSGSSTSGNVVNTSA